MTRQFAYQLIARLEADVPDYWPILQLAKQIREALEIEERVAAMCGREPREPDHRLLGGLIILVSLRKKLRYKNDDPDAP